MDHPRDAHRLKARALPNRALSRYLMVIPLCMDYGGVRLTYSLGGSQRRNGER